MEQNIKKDDGCFKLLFQIIAVIVVLYGDLMVLFNVIAGNRLSVLWNIFGSICIIITLGVILSRSK